MIEHKELHQQTPEWLKLKLGKIGGTRLKAVFGSSSLDLIDELIAEEGSGLHKENFVTWEMQRGIDLEPYVRNLFQELRGIEIQEVALCESDEYERNVCSPDGFSDDRKTGIEIKCPSTRKHVQYIRQGKVPNDYKYQILNYFLVNEKCQIMYFISFDDRYKPKPYFEVAVNREDVESELTVIREELNKFWEKFDKYKSIVNA